MFLDDFAYIMRNKNNWVLYSLELRKLREHDDNVGIVVNNAFDNFLDKKN